MPKNPSGLYYPNRIAHALFRAMDDVMGQHGLSTLLEIAQLEAYAQNPPPDNLEREFDFAAVAAMNAALEEMYGVRGGRGIASRIGQAAFASGLKSFGVMRAAADPAFRALPVERRAQYGLQSLAALFNNFSDQRNRVEEDSRAYQFIIENSPYAWGRQAEKPVCDMMSGILIESLRWVSNGYQFHVREVACRAAGSPECVFRIHRQPYSGSAAY
jgi:predicted hydrocarbon binding protein